MALSAGTTSAISSGVQVGAGLYTNWRNRVFTEKQNELDRNFQREINQQNRDWAIEDRDYMNAYNSPTQQMQRFKEAGLNPNLIYGKASEMPAMRTPAAQATKGNAPRIDNPLQNLNVAQAYYSAKLLEKQIQSIDVEIAGKKLQNENQMIDNKRNANDFMADVMVGYDPMNLGARAVGRVAGYYGQQTEKVIQELKYETAQTMSSIRTQQELEKLVEIQFKNSTNETERKYLEAKLKMLQNQDKMAEFEIQLNKRGLTKNDPNYLRILNTVIDYAITGK